MELVRKMRHLNILVVFMLLLQLAVYPANALGDVKKATITVEQAEQIVKDSFSIPEKYTQMSTGYNEYNNRSSYSLNWNAVEAPGGSFNAEVDATTGDILNVNQWEQPRALAFKLPVLSALEAEKIATGLVSKLASKHQAEMQLVKDEQQVSILNYMGPFTYNFHWVRVVGGIQFPENGVNVSISGDGQVRNYNYNWTNDLVFPEASNAITPEKAKQVFTDTPILELQYFLPQMMDPQMPQPQRVLLVYQLANKYPGGAIDALTGNPVTIDPPQVGIHKSMNVVSSISVATSVEATSSVIKATDQGTSDSKEQISQADAAAVVKKMVKIPSGLVLRNFSLSQDWQNPNEKVWNLDYNSEPYNSGEQGFLNARVNAKTGELVGFNMSKAVKSTNKANHLTRDGARKLAEEFLERVQPEKFKLVKDESGIADGGNTPDNTQFFNYVRVVNGIPVARNGMNITVDTVGKQVISYDLTWNNVEFPSPSDVLPMSEATEQFLKERPLALNYSLIFPQNGKQEVRLVYQPDTNSRMYTPGMIDAKTGNFMDWYGKSQSEWSMPHTYTDIQGNYAEKEIGIMGLTGAFGEYGETFRPDEKITAGSLLRAMLTAEGMNRDRVLSDEDVLKIAKDRTWIHDDLELGSELNREDLSKIMIRLISMEPSAQVKGIYVVPFTDANTIPADSLGYIALSWGLGILRIEGNAVQPKQSVTRAEAAYALVHAYALQPLNANVKRYY
ncbi:MAG TPA: YcdB/YcdC domain-containing protein [Desulfosporosinus sp.]|nr:YcdB/YcdC domain-containing protein [Desulfosporosinus sp.]